MTDHDHVPSPQRPPGAFETRVMSRRRFLGVVGGTGLAMSSGLLAACGGGGGSGSTTASGSQPAATGAASGGAVVENLIDPAPPGTDFAAIGPSYCSLELTIDDVLNWEVPKAARPYKIGYMLVSLQGYYFVGTLYGATEAAKLAGVELQRVAAQGFASPDVQLNQVRNLLQRGVDAIVLGPADVNGSVPVAEMALEAGVPVVVSGSFLNSPDVAQAVQSDYKLGQQAADEVGKNLGDHNPDGIIIAGPAAATWSTNRVQGFKDRAAEAYPEIKVVDAPNQNFVDPTEGLTSFKNATQANPDIGWVYSVDYNLLEAPSIPAEYQGKLLYVAMGLYGTSVTALEDGQLSAVFGILPVFGGMVGVSRAVQLLNGDSVPAVTCYPSPLYTSQNVSAPESRFDLYPSDFKV